MYLQPKPYRISTKVWLWTGKGAWHFVSVPKELSEEIKNEFGYIKQGWGSIAIELTLGESVWRTSMFPNSKTGEYLIPIKSAIRKAQNVNVDDIIDLIIQVLV